MGYERAGPSKSAISCSVYEDANVFAPQTSTCISDLDIVGEELDDFLRFLGIDPISEAPTDPSYPLEVPYTPMVNPRQEISSDLFAPFDTNTLYPEPFYYGSPDTILTTPLSAVERPTLSPSLSTLHYTASEGITHQPEQVSQSEYGAAYSHCIAPSLIATSQAESLPSSPLSYLSYDTPGETDTQSSDDVHTPRSTKSRKHRFDPYARPSSRRTSRQTTSEPYSPASVSSAGSLSPSSPSSSTRRRRQARPRNAQVYIPPEQKAKALRSKSCKCPVSRCGFSSIGRVADLERHMETHSSQMKWVCCGIPKELARQRGIMDAEEALEFNGRMMVGGCWSGFSRKDSLRRHVINEKNGCLGELSLGLNEVRDSPQ